ncbi:MAG: hypothetical protein ACK5Y2_14055 [Bdellovibrionales bacterium]
MNILITKDLKRLKVQTVSVAGRRIRVATLQELLAMKKESKRPQDLIDVKNIEAKLYGQKR